jgi:putative heme-binding domain-containing protein
MEAIETPSEIAAKYYARISAASAAGGGDPGAGEEVFADNCADCHQLKGEGGEIGPPLDGISEKGLKFITDSILRPTKKITEGYETYRVVDNEGRRHVGLKSRDDGTEIDITKANGEVVTIAKSDIKELEQDEVASVMPEDLTEAMTVKDFQDVQAFMMLQKPEEESQ